MIIARNNIMLLPQATSYFLMIMGAMVIVGWFSHTTVLVQVTPYWAPMQVNTALGFLIVGAGLKYSIANANRATRTTAYGLLLLGLATLLQYICGVNLGIDELFIDAYLLTETSHPGRMAPNTAVCFTLAGTALYIMQTAGTGLAKRYSIQSLGMVIALLGGISLIGYIKGTDTAYSWNNLTPMAVHTSIGFLMSGIAIILFSRDRTRKPPKWIEADNHQHFPSSIITILVLLSIGPMLLNMLGITFASSRHVLDIEEVANWGIPYSALTDEMFYALSGGFTHAILEWSAVVIAIVTAMLSYLHYRIKMDITVPVIGLVLLSSGLMDAYHMAAATRLVDAITSNDNLTPFTWAISRTFRACILLMGVILLLVFVTRKRSRSENKNTTISLALASLFFVILAIGLMQYVSSAETLPVTQFPDATITRPYDIIPLVIFLITIPLLWKLNTKNSSLFTSGLLLALLPECMVQIHMAFGSFFLYDNHFNVGHFLKIVAYMIPLIGLMLDYITTYARLKIEINRNMETQAELIRAKETAETASKMKSEFLANMSHEIRTPMNGVIGCAGLLLDSKLDGTQSQYTQTIMSSADSLLSLINDILDFSKIEAGKLAFEVIPVDMQVIAEEVVEMLSGKAHEKGIELYLHFPLKTHRHVKADPGRVRQVLTNLVGNAIKFTDQGHVKLQITSRVAPNGKIIFTLNIEDTGIGIAPEKMDSIFKKFDQADMSTTRKYGGTGLGLSITHNLVEMMNGSVKVESKQGKGSVFTATIMLESDVKAEETYYQHILPHGLKLLLVEDTPTAITIISDQLTGSGSDIDVAETAEAGYEKILNAAQNNAPYDIVITDQCLPGMDGTDLAKKVFATPAIAKTKMVLITSAPQKGDSTEAKNIGFAGYLAKPIFPTEVPKILAGVAQFSNKEDAPLVTRYSMQPQKQELETFPQLDNCHVLIAEDNAVNRMIATGMLEKFGCFITPAGNGLEAVQAATDRKYDLIFMDCQMPEMDGYEATLKIRDHEKKHGQNKTPVIAFTANAMTGDRDKCLQSGMDDYITKPVQIKVLENILKKWVSPKVRNTIAREAPEQEVNDIMEHLDHSTLKLLADHVGDVFPTIVQSYIDFSEKTIPELQEAVSNKDLNSIQEIAHSFKSSTYQLGAERLGALCEQLEGHAKAQNLDQLDGILQEMTSEHGHALQELKAIMADQGVLEKA